MADIKTPGEHGRKYDLNEVYQKAFGHVRAPYPTVLLQSRELGINPLGGLKALRGAFKFSSGLGTEFTLPTRLISKVSAAPNDPGWFQLPNEPTVSINGGNNLIETKLTRLDVNGQLNRQNVLEEINLNLFRIRIQGVLVNEENPEDYPEEQLIRLRDICLASGPKSIDNAITTMWGIQNIALEDFDFPAVKGNVAFQPYILIGYSDEVFELEVVETNA